MSHRADLHVLWFNLATDVDDQTLSFALRWLAEFAERVESVHVITMRSGPFDLPENVIVRSAGGEQGYGRLRRVLQFYRHLLAALSESRIDICFSHMIPIFSVLAAPVLAPRGVSTVTWYVHPRLTWTLRLAHAVSARVVSTLPSSYPYRRNKLIVLGHGVDTDLFSPGDTSPDVPPMILCVGRLSPVKEHATLIRAIHLLRERRTDVRAVIVGSPASRRDVPYVRSLHTLVSQLGLSAQLRFEPSKPLAELPDWYRRCTLHVNLSGEGFADKVALEAMSCGRLSLVANPGFRETLGAYADDLHFRYGDAANLADKIGDLLARPAGELQEMEMTLRTRVVEMHGLKRLVDRLVQLLTEETRLAKRRQS